MSMALLKPNYLADHPIWVGLLWAVLFVPTLVLLNWIQGQSVNLPVLIVAAVPAGIAWGYGMRWWYLTRRDARAPK